MGWLSMARRASMTGMIPMAVTNIAANAVIQATAQENIESPVSQRMAMNWPDCTTEPVTCAKPTANALVKGRIASAAAAGVVANR
jgi:hypothetical protein